LLISFVFFFFLSFEGVSVVLGASSLIRISPDGVQVDSVIPFGRQQALVRGSRELSSVSEIRVVKQLILNVSVIVIESFNSTADGAQVKLISRPQDRVPTVYYQPNSVSAIYLTNVPREIFVSCIVAPTIVSNSSANGTVVPGHLIVPANSTVMTNSSLNVTGSLVIGEKTDFVLLSFLLVLINVVKQGLHRSWTCRVQM
jgi:hypothetical protein